MRGSFHILEGNVGEQLRATKDPLNSHKLGVSLECRPSTCSLPKMENAQGVLSS